MRNTKKRIGKWWLAAIGLIVMVASVQTHVLDVSAGSEQIAIDKTSFEKELDGTKWNAPNGDVIAKDGVLVFSKDSTEETRLITRKPVTNTEIYDELFRANYTMRLSELPEGQKFIVAFSLSTAESYYDDSESLQVVFTNESGIKVSVVMYDEAGEEKVLVEKTGCGISLGSKIQMSAKATSDNHITIVVNNKSLYQDEAPVDLSGRLGFLQTGSCVAEIYDVDIISYNYVRPENDNVEEDFENGGMNVNTVTSTMLSNSGYFPAGVLVEEYNGSNVLMFRNVAHGFFGTKYQYSNFELSFDVPYLLRSTLTDEEGNITAKPHTNFVLGIGDATDQFTAYGYTGSADAVVFNPDSVSGYKSGIRVDISEKGYYDSNKNEGYSVKVSVIDTVVTVYMKALDATKYDQIMQYSTGDATPVGYVHLWTTGGSTNFAIDNFKLVNKDEKANLLNLEYKLPGEFEAEDWEYEPMEVVYTEAEAGDTGFNWAMLLVYGIIAGVVIIATCTIVSVVRKRPKKGEIDVHEG